MLTRRTIKMNDKEVRELILGTVEDLVADLCYYDRKNDEDLSGELFEYAVSNKVVTVPMMVQQFKKALEDVYS